MSKCNCLILCLSVLVLYGCKEPEGIEPASATNLSELSRDEQQRDEQQRDEEEPMREAVRTEYKVSDVPIGMTEEEVRAKLGPPDFIDSSDKSGRELWTYWPKFEVLPKPAKTSDGLSILMKDGKVYKVDPMYGDVRVQPGN